jgi:PAS domain S-box-containing protein
MPETSIDLALRRPESCYREIFERSRAANFVASADGAIVACNASFARLLGFNNPQDAMAASADALYVSPKDRQQFVRLMTEAGDGGYETTLVRLDGSAMAVLAYGVGRIDTQGQVVEADGFLIARSDHQHPDAALPEGVAQLRQGQRMEAMGRVAGGMAHDFNNVLTTILGFSELLLQEATLDAPARADVEQISRSATSGTSLTRQLLAFGRKQALKPASVNLNQLVTDLAATLHGVIGDGVALTTTVAPESAWVSADRGQLEQVLMNLAVNARDAMPGGGRLDIAVKGGERSVALEVRDTGCGMAADVVSQIFEPFFTTKKAGMGAGLGLAAVYGIVTQSGGSIEVDSEVGRGTVFSICMPRFIPVRSSITPPAAAARARGREIVLVVEDQAAVRSLVKAVLERQGYTVVIAEDGETALGVIERRAPEIDLLLSDVVMPGMNGPDILAKSTALQPNLRVLLMTGYSPSLERQMPGLPAGVGVLHKPFTPAQLSTMVRDALDAPKRNGPDMPAGRDCAPVRVRS